MRMTVVGTALAVRAFVSVSARQARFALVIVATLPLVAVERCLLRTVAVPIVQDPPSVLQAVRTFRSPAFVFLAVFQMPLVPLVVLAYSFLTGPP